MALTARSRLGAPVRAIGAWLPHGWGDFWVQFVIFWTFNLGYELSRGLSDGQRDAAFENGRRVMELERHLGFFWELDVQRWTRHQPDVVESIANYTYFNCQFTISFGLMMWIYLRRNHAFYFVRNSILFADILGLVGYVTIPTAPPRFFTQLGFVDTLERAVVNHQTGFVASLANEYAAMPSLHTAYAVTLGTAGVLVCRTRPSKLWWSVYPALVVFSIVATGNHFLLDAVAGFFVALFASMLSLCVARGVVPRPDRVPRGPLTPRLGGGRVALPAD